MKEQYIKQVMKELAGVGRKKQEIKRDLLEIFDSAMEHGQTEEQVIKRLGSPQDFALEMMGKQGFKRKKMRNNIAVICGLAAAAVCGILIWMIQSSRVPEGVIGYAEGTTSIEVQGGWDITPILWGIGIAALVVAAIFVIRNTKTRK